MGRRTREHESAVRGGETLDDQLRRETGAPDVRYFLVVRAAGRKQALAASERSPLALNPLVASGAIAGFDSPAGGCPAKRPNEGASGALPDAATLTAQSCPASRNARSGEDVFAPFLADVAAARRAAAAAAGGSGRHQPGAADRLVVVAR